MRYLLIILVASNAWAIDNSIQSLAKANGYNPSQRVITAISNAAMRYHVSPLELTAIGILETGLGRYNRVRRNSNGTIDQGIFQINSVNVVSCIEYNLASIEGNAYCAAKLLNTMALKHHDYLGRYHSSNLKRKIGYQNAVLKVLSVQALNID